ncbi:MAG: beta-ketoacyl-ACP synthase II [Lachnospiraceae bacterium]|nr:beta-ketoacyl-ACP synthase II [Lachnospiraceae bacterium]
MRRVVITGLGAVTPIGNSVDEFWESVHASRHGFAPITRFDTADFKCKIAAEVKNFDAKNYMDPKTARRMEPFSQLAVAAAQEAMKDSGLDMEKEDVFRVGTSIGSGVGSMASMEREDAHLVSKGPRMVNPLFIPMFVSNMAAGNVAIILGLRGKSINVVTACATGSHSIGEAFRTIQYGDADVMFAGGTEHTVTPLSVAGFTQLTALSTSEDPDRASLPFDKDRNGFVMGEGSGIVVLEELEHAKARGAKIYAEMAGYGASSDAYHITSPIEDGSGAAYAMKAAIKDAALSPEDIIYINAHGTGTHHNDLFETRSIKKVFGEHAYKMKINSTKSMIGHLLGGAGAVEFITCVKEIEEGYLHRTLGYKTPDEEMDLNYLPEESFENVEYALSNSLGFGGHNASLLVKKYRD